jgi:hypothetical protein
MCVVSLLAVFSQLDLDQSGGTPGQGALPGPEGHGRRQRRRRHLSALWRVLDPPPTRHRVRRGRVARVVCRVSCVVCRVSCVVCRVSCVVCRVSCVVCRVSCVVCRVSGVVCRVSCLVSSFVGRVLRLGLPPQVQWRFALLSCGLLGAQVRQGGLRQAPRASGVLRAHVSESFIFGTISTKFGKCILWAQNKI